MRIIKNAMNKQYTCSHCGSILEVSDEDIWLNPKYGDYYICPCCGNTNYINTEENETD